MIIEQGGRNGGKQMVTRPYVNVEEHQRNSFELLNAVVRNVSQAHTLLLNLLNLFIVYCKIISLHFYSRLHTNITESISSTIYKIL